MEELNITEVKSKNSDELKEEKIVTFSSYDGVVYEHKRLKNAPVMHDLTIKANIFLLITSFIFEIYALISLIGLKNVNDDGIFIDISKHCSVGLSMAVIQTTFGFFLGSMIRHNRLKDSVENTRKFSKVYILLMVVEFIMISIIFVIGLKYMDAFVFISSTLITTFAFPILGVYVSKSIKPQDV